MGEQNTVVESSPEVLGGIPVFAGTRVPVQTLIDCLEGGERLDDFLDDFPTVSRSQAIAALEFEADRQDRIAAVHELAAMNLPVADWEQMERESVEVDQHVDGIPGITRVDPLQWASQHR